MQMKIYISGALDAASDLELARHKYDELANHLRNFGFLPYVPHHKTDPVLKSDISSSDVFFNDLNAMLESEALVAFFDEPSFGVGSEVAIALERGIPVIGLIAKDKKFSRFLEGMILASPIGIIFRYPDLESAALFVKNNLPLNHLPFQAPKEDSEKPNDRGNFDSWSLWSVPAPQH